MEIPKGTETPDPQEKTIESKALEVPNQQPQPLPTTDPPTGGKDGEGGGVRITDTEFIAEIFKKTPDGAYAAVCPKPVYHGVDVRQLGQINISNVLRPVITIT
jgi:hypothetical protein